MYEHIITVSHHDNLKFKTPLWSFTGSIFIIILLLLNYVLTYNLLPRRVECDKNLYTFS